jgi:GH15 family glucan-1,4-alpha-glucosidase
MSEMIPGKYVIFWCNDFFLIFLALLNSSYSNNIDLTFRQERGFTPSLLTYVRKAIGQV